VNSASGAAAPAPGSAQGAVGDAVVHRGQIGQVEQVAQALLAGGIERGFDVLGLAERKMHRDRLAAGADLDAHRWLAISSCNCSR
jgi:hypothetical protein